MSRISGRGHKTTVLVVESDAGLQTVLCRYLEQEGYQVLSALSGKEMVQKLESALPGIILLNLVLPDVDGFTLLTTIRSKGNAAIIAINGKDAFVDRIISLEMGADDCLTKPFELRELLARIKAVLRRTKQERIPSNDMATGMIAKADRIYFNGWVLDRQKYQVFNRDDIAAELTSGEFKLLEAMLISPNRVLSRERLFELTRPGNFDAFDRAIDIQIGRIRKKINDNSRNPALIKTVRGVGYMFAGESRASS